jgi:hypothetical protein
VGKAVGGREENREEEEAVEKDAEDALGTSCLRMVDFEENETTREKLAVCMGIYRFFGDSGRGGVVDR